MFIRQRNGPSNEHLAIFLVASHSDRRRFETCWIASRRNRRSPPSEYSWIHGRNSRSFSKLNWMDFGSLVWLCNSKGFCSLNWFHGTGCARNTRNINYRLQCALLKLASSWRHTSTWIMNCEQFLGKKAHRGSSGASVKMNGIEADMTHLTVTLVQMINYSLHSHWPQNFFFQFFATTCSFQWTARPLSTKWP